MFYKFVKVECGLLSDILVILIEQVSCIWLYTQQSQ